MLFVLFFPFVSRGFFLAFNVFRTFKNHLRFRTICYNRCSLFPFRHIIIILKIVSSNIGNQSNNDSQNEERGYYWSSNTFSSHGTPQNDYGKIK